MREGNWIDRSLDPVDRLSEVMFGLLMTLTFTGTMSVALAEGQQVRSILFAALGCNLAWGIVDGVMHLLTTAAERGRRQVLVARLRRAPAGAKAVLVRGLLPEGSGLHLSDAEAGWLAALVERAAGEDDAPRLTREDFLAAAAVFVVVVTATFPPVLPFLLVGDTHVAMRWSNGIAVLMLFGIGLGLDHYVEGGSRMMRWVVPLLGVVLVATTIALGG
jgi:VIT1/CCC1 family predicted Fe2+/Mn2+ transporter